MTIPADAPGECLAAFDDAFPWHVVPTCKELAGTGDEDAIADEVAAWATPAERVTFALGALRALSPSAVETVCETVLAELRGGAPGAPFDKVMVEARSWADLASPSELRAYTWAAFHAMPPGSRQRFLAAVYQHAQAEAA